MTFLIRFYQITKPLRTHIYTSIGLHPHPCRHQPSCSQYTLTAIKRYGTIRGVLKGLIRILSCHSLPFPLSSSKMLN